MTRLLVGAKLVLLFLSDVVRSGLSTAWLIVRPGPRPTPGLLRMPFSGLDARGASVLGAMITLTPGTTTLLLNRVHGLLKQSLYTRVAGHEGSYLLHIGQRHR